MPAAVLGILLDDWMDAHLYNSVVVALMLIVYGVAFILIERRPRVPTTTKLSRITYPQAFKVGCWQVLSLIPGTSRSGSTILGGMLCGMSRPAASQFTFFLAIPVMAGASLLKLVKFFGKGNSFTLDQTVVLIVGCAVAFIVSIIAIRFLMDYVKRHTFTAFGVYRIALGIVVLVIWGVHTGCGTELTLTTPISITDYKLNTYVQISSYTNVNKSIILEAISLCDHYEHIFSRTLAASELYKIGRASCRERV